MREFQSMEGVVLDFCSRCHGLWFDKGEVAFYLEARKDLPDAQASVDAGHPTSYSCPKCQGRLVEIPFNPGKSVMVDICEGCGGIYVDKGELALMETLSAQVEPISKLGRTIGELVRRGFHVLGVGKTK